MTEDIPKIKVYLKIRIRFSLKNRGQNTGDSMGNEVSSFVHPSFILRSSFVHPSFKDVGLTKDHRTIIEGSSNYHRRIRGAPKPVIEPITWIKVIQRIATTARLWRKIKTGLRNFLLKSPIR